jgi:hypothetical protein
MSNGIPKAVVAISDNYVIRALLRADGHNLFDGFSFLRSPVTIKGVVHGFRI